MHIDLRWEVAVVWRISKLLHRALLKAIRSLSFLPALFVLLPSLIVFDFLRVTLGPKLAFRDEYRRILKLFPLELLVHSLDVLLCLIYVQVDVLLVLPIPHGPCLIGRNDHLVFVKLGVLLRRSIKENNPNGARRFLR